MPQKILFLVPYPLRESPSQRFRFEQYFDILKENDFEIKVQSFLTSKNWRLFFKSGNLTRKTWAVMAGFFRRTVELFNSTRYDFIFIHREAAPLGPPILEWILAKVLQKKIIFDFDDAIWLTDRKHESWLMNILKWRAKVRSVCKWSMKVSCGNEYLCDYARRYNKNVVYNPTTIDTQDLHNPAEYKRSVVPGNPIVVGWTGSYSTVKYLRLIESAFQNIEKQFPTLQILVIADREPDLKLTSLRYVPWDIRNETIDLLKIDIGVMPLPDDLWAKGKCGFKALQYMALKIPAVVSPVGVNTSIVDDGKNGFLCSSIEEWESALATLIQDKNLRNEMGESGRKKVIDHYSVLSNTSNFLALFE